MEPFERVKQVRKYFSLSQDAFGEKLGVSRSVIKNIELNLLAKPDQKLSLLKLICSTFGVSEEWLIDGNGDMFVETAGDYIDKLALEYSLDELDLQIIQTFLELEKDDRAVIKKYLHRLATATQEKEIDKELEEIRKELELEKKAKEKYEDLGSINLGNQKNA
ncbi:hypothetical protein HMPREF9630_00242 [Peptoanaerobacter stomatis]|uniref:HTH cro/C1-type domain-containing protein n=1 Tax=Peptoanaerobacter stomatis TaxID=796937 RepID=V9HSK5_9FIRM|nr:helix-turn-helix transcriptional regulator [Peptoanaerobacter stomatis]EHL18517.1 hypothetical protein HMPREF9630_00242 [Peptoanaerobacter stomatis]